MFRQWIKPFIVASLLALSAPAAAASNHNNVAPGRIKVPPIAQYIHPAVRIHARFESAPPRLQLRKQDLPVLPTVGKLAPVPPTRRVGVSHPPKPTAFVHDHFDARQFDRFDARAERQEGATFRLDSHWLEPSAVRDSWSHDLR